MAKREQNQQGIVSITVTIVLMIVITLIVLTFAKIIRREQRQALDRQLSTQAFYAAESGINNVVSAIKGGYSASKTDCVTPSGNSTIDNNNISPNVSVSCVTVNQSPDNLYYDPIDQTSTVVPLQSGDGSSLSTVTLKWQAKPTSSNPLSNCAITNNFPANGSWNCPVGILRIDLVPTAGIFTRSALNTSMLSAFLYPSTSGGTLGYGSGSGTTNQGVISGALCNGSPVTCTMTISGLGTNKYAMRVRSLYLTSTLSITAINNLGKPVALSNAQAIVDSTGKANDVLRRVQVRVPLSGAGSVPDFAIQTSGDICKRYMFVSNSSNVLLGATDGGATGLTDTANPCSLVAN